MNLGLQETNGHQYYKNWEQMLDYHPMSDASWVQTRDGVYLTGEEFYKKSGGILAPSTHYEKMFDV